MTTVITPSKVSPEAKADLIRVSSAMLTDGLPADFVTSALEIAFRYEGACGLMMLWQEESESEERDEIIADLQEMIDDCSQDGHSIGTYVNFEDLDTIAKDVRTFKDSLRLIVDERGGLTKLSEMTGIPQPSLSRMFNSASMPQRVTLLKIARALDLSEVQIATKWVRH